MKNFTFNYRYQNLFLRTIFAYEFKLGCNAAQTAPNNNLVGDEGCVNEFMVQRCYKMLCLEEESHDNRPTTIDDNQLKVLVERLIHDNNPVPSEKLNVHASTVARHSKQIGNSKKLNK